MGIPRLPEISYSQPELYLDLVRAAPAGPFVLVVNYATSPNQEATSIQVQASTQDGAKKGAVTIYRCRYRTLCRQVVSDKEGKVAVFYSASKDVKLVLMVSGPEGGERP